MEVRINRDMEVTINQYSFVQGLETALQAICAPTPRRWRTPLVKRDAYQIGR
jgi:hypothetical protein